MAEALVALGGNIGDARDTLDRAIAAFCDGEKVRLLARSSDYRTAPWGVEDQPPFERSKERRWGPRPVDIDLVAYDDLVLQEPDLTLPHPQLFGRAFVLAPLAEIAPDRLIAGRRVRDALAQVDASGVEKLPPRP